MAQTNMASIKYDNIFAAVSDNREEASELQIRADLMIVIRDIFRDSGCSKNEFAEKIGLTRPRTSNLLNGQLDKFSIDLLLTCLFRLGFRFKPSYENHRLKMTVQAV